MYNNIKQTNMQKVLDMERLLLSWIIVKVTYENSDRHNRKSKLTGIANRMWKQNFKQKDWIVIKTQLVHDIVTCIIVVLGVVGSVWNVL